jgi:hypothetical protein
MAPIQVEGMNRLPAKFTFRKIGGPSLLPLLKSLQPIDRRLGSLLQSRHGSEEITLLFHSI